MKKMIRNVLILLILKSLSLNSMSDYSPGTYHTLAEHHHFHFSKLDIPDVVDGAIKCGNVAALFCEIKNYSELCQNNNPRACATLLKFFFNKAVECVNMHGGKINKYTGASFFAVFSEGVLIGDKLVCNKALSAAFSLLNIEETLQYQEIADIQLAIGLNYGFVARGKIGLPRFCEDTYIGDAINVASRLQAMCYKLNQNIVASQKFFNELDLGYRQLFSEPVVQYLKGRSKKTFMYVYSCLNESSVLQGKSRNNHIYDEKLIDSLSQTDRSDISVLEPRQYVAMCCDIRNFTTYSERDPCLPDAILRFLNVYHSELSLAALKFGGVPYKILGDGILVVFPISNKFDLCGVCNNAMKCALKFLNIADKFGIENGVGIDVLNDCSFSVGVSCDDEYNLLTNNIFIGTGIKRVLDLEAINKNPYIHKALNKHIVASDAFHENLSEPFSGYFDKLNPYLSSKRKRPIWGYMYNCSVSFPDIVRKSRKSNKGDGLDRFKKIKKQIPKMLRLTN